MILEEQRLITLSNDGRYLLVNDLGEIEGEEGKRFFLAIGVTPDYDLDISDIIFLETFKENDETVVTRVNEGTELYNTLSFLEVVSTAMENIPDYKEQLAKEINRLNNESNK